MRIALACPYAWDAPGGVQVQVRELGERLRSRGHEVLVITPSRGHPVEGWVRSVGRPIAVPYNRSVAPICPWPASARRVRELLRRFAPEVVHAHEPLTPSTSMFALLAGAAPVVATFHSGADRALLFDLTAPALRRVASRIDIRVAVSRAASSFAARRIGDGFRIVSNGIDVDRFADAVPVDGLPEGRRVLFVGRLDARKGFPVAVAAFSRLAERVLDVRLLVVGDGPDARAVETLRAGVRERVDLVGRVANSELHVYEAAADVFVAPSVGGESFGVILIEAMAAGLPVVASDIPGYDEVVDDGVQGLLVPPRDPGALSEAVGRILEHPALAGRFARAGRERARQFSWTSVVGRYEALYEEAAESRASR